MSLADFALRLFEAILYRQHERNQWSKIGRTPLSVQTECHKTRPNITFAEPISKICAIACWAHALTLSSLLEPHCKWLRRRKYMKIEKCRWNDSIICTQIDRNGRTKCERHTHICFWFDVALLKIHFDSMNILCCFLNEEHKNPIPYAKMLLRVRKRLLYAPVAHNNAATLSVVQTNSVLFIYTTIKVKWLVMPLGASSLALSARCMYCVQTRIRDVLQWNVRSDVNNALCTCWKPKHAHRTLIQSNGLSAHKIQTQ